MRTIRTEGEKYNSVPNYEIITITVPEIRTIRSIFTACGISDKWYQSSKQSSFIKTKSDFGLNCYYFPCLEEGWIDYIKCCEINSIKFRPWALGLSVYQPI